MAAPQVENLPTAPSRNDNPDVFAQRADAFVAALSSWTVDINTATDWANLTFDSVETNANNAASSAALSEDWASTTGATVDGQEYAAKEWAVGSTAESAKRWATDTGATVDGTEYSSKEYASGTAVPTGSSKEWATNVENVADGLKGARGYAQDASDSASSAATDATRAESAVSTLPAGTIADAIIAPDKAWSSQKINSLLTLEDKATLKFDFVRDEYYVDDGSRTFAPAEYDMDVERATPKWVEGPNGKLREVPIDTVARQWRNGVPQGALIEESRTNLLLWSEAFDNAVWGTDRTSVTANSTTAPDSTLSADQVVEDTGTGGHVVRQASPVVPVAQGSTYTFSVFLASNGRDALIRFVDERGGQPGAYFDLTTGAVLASSSGVAAEIHLTTLGFYKCAITYTFSDAITTPSPGQCRVFLSQGTTENYTGDGTSGIYIWGAQLEEASAPSSYIPTTDAPATRAADNVSRTLGGEFNASEFTLIAKGIDIVSPPAGVQPIIKLNNSLDGGQRGIGIVSNDVGELSLQLRTADGFKSTPFMAGVDAAFTFSIGGVVVSVGGQTAFVALTESEFLALRDQVTHLFIGSVLSPVAGGSSPCGFTAKACYVLPSALTEAELIELTSQ